MPISYREAGVDIDAGNEFVRRIAPLARKTRTADVLSDVGGFAGLMALPAGMRNPVLVSGTDGVGTKLALAFATGVHHTIGIDLVAMCVNDVATSGARPLFFLDYFATSALDVTVAEQVVRGIATGCQEAGCALLGGETAELPGMYQPGHYDLAGFAVGVVERADLLPRHDVQAGDRLVAVASSGLHSNGYSLARRVLLERMQLDLDQPMPGVAGGDESVGEVLLRPTRIYVRAITRLADTCGDQLRGVAHITGGGLTENVARILPPGTVARMDLDSYRRPAVFGAIQHGGPVDEAEMRRTFNLGVGLVAVVTPAKADQAIAALCAEGEDAWALGEVESAPDGQAVAAARFVGDSAPGR